MLIVKSFYTQCDRSLQSKDGFRMIIKEHHIYLQNSSVKYLDHEALIYYLFNAGNPFDFFLYIWSFRH